VVVQRTGTPSSLEESEFSLVIDHKLSWPAAVAQFDGNTIASGIAGVVFGD
jgi:hypothetical protein